MSAGKSKGDDELPLGDTLEFLRMLWALDHSLLRASKRIEASLGVTGPQRMVIRIVGRFPGISAGRLARVLHVHPSTLTGVLRRLQRQRLIARWPDPRDERRALLGLTPKGRKLDVDTAGTIEERVRQLLAETEPRRIAETAGVLRRLAELLEVEPPPAEVARRRR